MLRAKNRVLRSAHRASRRLFVAQNGYFDPNVAPAQQRNSYLMLCCIALWFIAEVTRSIVLSALVSSTTQVQGEHYVCFRKALDQIFRKNNYISALLATFSLRKNVALKNDSIPARNQSALRLWSRWGRGPRETLCCVERQSAVLVRRNRMVGYSHIHGWM